MELPRIVQHIGYVLAYLAGDVIFRVFNSLKVEGRKNVPRKKNVLFVVNHRTLADNWMITCAAYGLAVARSSELTPYHPAAVENFLNTPWKRLVFGKFLKCLPVERGKFDTQSLDVMIEKLTGGTMITFPEGTRTRTGKVGTQGRLGVGYLIYKARPTVIPVYHEGTQNIMPVGSTRLHFGHKVSVKIGKPMDLSEFYKLPDEKETWQKIADATLQTITNLQNGTYK